MANHWQSSPEYTTTKCTCMTPNLKWWWTTSPLVSMYNSASKTFLMRVAKHTSKLRGFNFSLTYEPGTSIPADYGSRNPPPKRN